MKSWKRQRRDEYLKRWPIHAQMEALTEAAAGRPDKLDRLLADVESIKAGTPKPKKDPANE